MVSEKKKSVLESAELLFSSNGFNETTVAEIAKESGIHEASIYSYFNNKRNILFTIYSRYLQNAIQTLKQHFQGMKEPGPKLRKAIWHYLADMKDHPNYARILMMAQRENPDFYASEHVQYVKQFSSLLLKIVITGQKEGLFRSDISPRMIRNMGMGASVFTVFDSIANNRPYEPNEISDRIYQLVIDGTGQGSPAVEKNWKTEKMERAEFRKSQIVETAIQVFANKGFSNATISDVAKQANLGDATLYEYFGSKEAILLNTSETYFQKLVTDETFSPGNPSKPEKSLQNLIWRWIWLLYSHENFSRVLVLELLRKIKFYSSPGYKYLTNYFEEIRNVIQNGQKEGIFIDNVPFPTYFHLVIGTFDQYLLSQFLLNRPPLGLAELNNVVDSLVRAIKVRE